MESNKGGACEDEEATKVRVLMDASSGVRILATQLISFLRRC